MHKHTHRQGVAFDYWLTDYSIDKPNREIAYLMQVALTVANSQRTKKNQLKFKDFVLKPKRKPKRMTKEQMEFYSEMAMACWAVRLGFDMDGKPKAKAKS